MLNSEKDTLNFASASYFPEKEKRLSFKYCSLFKFCLLSYWICYVPFPFIMDTLFLGKLTEEWCFSQTSQCLSSEDYFCGGGLTSDCPTGVRRFLRPQLSTGLEELVDFEELVDSEYQLYLKSEVTNEHSFSSWTDKEFHSGSVPRCISENQKFQMTNGEVTCQDSIRNGQVQLRAPLEDKMTITGQQMEMDTNIPRNYKGDSFSNSIRNRQALLRAPLEDKMTIIGQQMEMDTTILNNYKGDSFSDSIRNGQARLRAPLEDRMTIISQQMEIDTTIPTNYKGHSFSGIPHDLFIRDNLKIRTSPLQSSNVDNRTNKKCFSACLYETNQDKPCQISKFTTPNRRKRYRPFAAVRERQRLRVMNEAYEKLKGKLPLNDPGEKLSKKEILRMAISYIKFLMKLLEDSSEVEKSQLDSHTYLSESEFCLLSGRKEWIYL